MSCTKCGSTSATRNARAPSARAQQNLANDFIRLGMRLVKVAADDPASDETDNWLVPRRRARQAHEAKERMVHPRGCRSWLATGWCPRLGRPDIVEERAVEPGHGFVAITVGGGGIPVVADADDGPARRRRSHRQGLRRRHCSPRSPTQTPSSSGPRQAGGLEQEPPDQRWIEPRGRLSEALPRRGDPLAPRPHGAQDRGPHRVPRAWWSRRSSPPGELELALAGEARHEHRRRLSSRRSGRLRRRYPAPTRRRAAERLCSRGHHESGVVAPLHRAHGC